MLMPKKVKYRKWHKGRSRNRQVETRGITVSFGAYGMKAASSAYITSRQIEATRRAITRHIQKGGKLWIRIFPDKPITKKPPEVGMGKGKGAPDHYVFPVRPGRILFELDGVSEEIAREAFRRGGAKLPLKTKFVERV